MARFGSRVARFRPRLAALACAVAAAALGPAGAAAQATAKSQVQAAVQTQAQTQARAQATVAAYLPAAALPYTVGVPAKSEGKADIAALVPRAAGVETLVRRLTGSAQADRLRFEALGVLARPPEFAARAGGTAAAVAEERAVIAGILNAVGRMQGLDYWSASRNTWRLLYEESYRVSAAAGGDRLSDLPAPAAGAIPSTWAYYAFQKDLTFGANLYRYDLSADADGFLATSSNETPLKVLFVTAVAPGDMKATLAILPARDGIVVYVITTMKAMDLLKRKAFDSVGNRAYALFWWFAKQAEAAGIAVAPAIRPIAAE